MLSDRRAIGLLMISALGGACAHRVGPHARPDRVAVLPLDSIGVEQKDVSRMDRTITRQIEQVVGAPVVDRDRVERRATSTTACRERSSKQAIPCGAEVGQAVGASHVVFGAVGRLGKTWMLRLKLLRVKEATVARSVEETLFGTAELDRSLARVTERLFDLPRRRPWYTRWWLWTLVGAGVTAAIVVPLSLPKNDDSPYKDVPFP